MGNLVRVAPVVVCLLAVNIGVFAINWIAENNGANLNWEFGLFYFDSPEFSFLQILSHLFMHGGIAHLFFNMFALLMFGSQLEAIWGAKRFILFYFITGLGAALLHQCVQAFEVYQIANSITPGSDLNLQKGYQFARDLESLNFKYFVPIIGASGSIFGLLLGYAVLFPNAKLIMLIIPYPVKAKYAIPVLMLVELFLGVQNFSFDNIAHFAHLGGALFGFILVKLWSRKPNLGFDDEKL